MNIKILDSWLREYLDTKATPKDIARELSLTSVSIERSEKKGDDYIYDIEVTTNRPDLMSVRGIAKEAAAVLPEHGISAKFIDKKISKETEANISFPIEIIRDPKLVNRILAVVMEVNIDKSPEEVSKRLEASDIRSLNNVIDVTNYIMREIGHPAHVFDFDRLNTKKMIIRESKKGEKLITLDGKEYELNGGDIIADNGSGEIVDLLGIMGTQNSVVTDNTKRILFFLDNLNPRKIRKTSMNLGIRTEAAVINEKGIDPELMTETFSRGIELFKKNANGKIVTKIIDIYPNKPKTHIIRVSNEKINKILGVEIKPEKSKQILENLGFKTIIAKDYVSVEVPTIRVDEVTIEEDIIEEIARVYGYHKLPSIIPTFLNNKPYKYADNFYFEEKVKNAFKYFGYTEVFTYSLVSESMFMGPIENALKLKNPLTEDMKYLRNSLIPGLLEVINENKSYEKIHIFELSILFEKDRNNLPKERMFLGGAVKKYNVSFFEVKGVIEQVLNDIGVKNLKFKNKNDGFGAIVSMGQTNIGFIEILNNNTIDFELDFDEILKHASIKKTYKPLAKFPPIIEDITFVLDESIPTDEISEEIKLQSFLISSVSLKDQYENSKTFHIIYQATDRSLTNKEISEIREQIINAIQRKFGAKVK